MKQQNLKESVNLKIRGNDDLLYEISKVMKRYTGTVRNWIYSNSYMLTAPPVLEIISKHINMPVDELLEEAPANN